MRMIGEITYERYLSHFPIQLSIIWTTKYCSIPFDYTKPIWIFLILRYSDIYIRAGFLLLRISNAAYATATSTNYITMDNVR